MITLGHFQNRLDPRPCPTGPNTLQAWCTRMRLLASSGTTSATLPRATRSSSSPMFGWGLLSYQPRLRKRARRAIST